MAALNLLFSSSQDRKEAEPNGPKKTIKLHTHIRTCADKCSVFVCKCFRYRIASGSLTRLPQITSCGCMYIRVHSVCEHHCVYVCARKGVQVAYGVGAGCGNESAGNANSAHMYNRKELSYHCLIMQKAANNYVYLVNHYFLCKRTHTHTHQHKYSGTQHMSNIKFITGVYTHARLFSYIYQVKDLQLQ